MERQRLASIGETEELCIHAEGGTTNGHLIQFKKGAFAALLPIRPKAVRYVYPTISPSSGVLDGIVHHVLVCGCLWSRVEVDEMPVFRPNEFFWENHQKEGEEKWQTYARIIKQIIHEEGRIPYAENSELAIEDKNKYKALLWPKKEKSGEDTKKD